MVELLVVIGIIALLISILVPTLAKVRRAAQGTACLSNLRQLSNAVMMYTADSKGWMVTAAPVSNYYWNSPGSVSSAPAATAPNSVSNWIAWHSIIDPATGAPSGYTAIADDQNLTYSSIAPYLNIPVTISQAPGGAGNTGAPAGAPNSNSISAQYANVFTCPGDDVLSRPNQGGNKEAYRYSYSLNQMVSMPVKPTNARVWGTFNGKITSIQNASDIVMFACEDSQTLDDGVLVLNAAQWTTGVVNTVSPRHYANNNVTAQNATQTTGVNQDGLGNCSFCDGHAGIIGRKDALRAQHSGSPTADPTPGTSGPAGVW